MNYLRRKAYGAFFEDGLWILGKGVTNYFAFQGSKPGLIETAQTHRETANEMIPTFDEIDEWKEEHREYIMIQGF